MREEERQRRAEERERVKHLHVWEKVSLSCSRFKCVISEKTWTFNFEYLYSIAKDSCFQTQQDDSSWWNLVRNGRRFLPTGTSAGWNVSRLTETCVFFCILVGFMKPKISFTLGHWCGPSGTCSPFWRTSWRSRCLGCRWRHGAMKNKSSSWLVGYCTILLWCIYIYIYYEGLY